MSALMTLSIGYSYPHRNVFEICETNRWKYFVNLKNSSPGKSGSGYTGYGRAGQLRFEDNVAVKQGKKVVYEAACYEGIERLEYKGHMPTWIACYHPPPREKPNKGKAELPRFTYLTRFEINKKEEIVKVIVKAGRLRGKSLLNCRAFFRNIKKLRIVS